MMIFVQDFNVLPAARSFHSSHNPANKITYHRLA
jgi:hypothetical protein